MTRSDWFTLVRFLHILGAVVALGFSLSYGLWLARAEVAGGTARPFALRTISWIDRRLTTPAYVLQLVTGLVLVFLVDASLLRRAWIELSVGLYVLVVTLAISVYAPVHRRQTALAERLAAGEAVQTEYAEVSAKSRRAGLLVTALTLAILVLMVFKPALWS